MALNLRPGQPGPLGAWWDGSGTNFAVFSASAPQVWLCLFDATGAEQRIRLTEVDAFIWHGYVPCVGPGTRYGYRIGDPANPDLYWHPEQGPRVNPDKLLLDPYALAVDQPLDWGSTDGDAETYFDYRWSDGARNAIDSGPRMPHALVVDPSFDWSTEQRPAYGLADTVIYETHVRGMTMQHPGVPASDRGTYRGLAHPEVIRYLQELGVTTLELLPVQQFFVGRGQTNFWGYDPICFMAPHGAYAAGGHAGQQVGEFQEMVLALHTAGLEVILDVVFNHTFEGGNPRPGTLPPWHVGPCLSLRGLDNASYYMLDPSSPPGQVPYYVNETGVGNTLNIWDPAALRLIMDSLRHWAVRMHVDGFRFDLGAVLAQTDAQHSVSVFLDQIAQDPTLNRLKLIAEPWFGDMSHPQLLGRFPPLWSQWNGDFHWAMRDFWKSTGSAQAFTQGLLGSPETFNAADGEQPTASINYCASHDGLTLHDSVAYNDDGQHAWDCRAPGQSETDPAVVTLRARMARNLAASAVLAQGVPMLLYGDECGRTQDGNNNAYDIDGPQTWMPWNPVPDPGLLGFVRRTVALRREHPAFRRRRFFQDGGGVSFFSPQGAPLREVDVAGGGPVALAMFIDGAALPAPGPDGKPVVDTRSFLLLLNASWDSVEFALSPTLPGMWSAELATETVDGTVPSGSLPLTRAGRSLLVLSRGVAGAPAR